jgi:hypothetical protein
MDTRSAVIRTLCFHAAWNYAPTLAELILTLDGGVGAHGHAPGTTELGIDEALDCLKNEGLVIEDGGRLALAEGSSEILRQIRERDVFQARKRRRAVRVTKWLASQGSVRFVALANTTALGNARDEGDLDFFVIAKSGTIWTTRLLGAGLFKLFGKLPTKNRTRDAVCLSYFVSEDGMKLAPHMLAQDDPYFRYWFLSLVPLYDDGVGEKLWLENRDIIARHPFARRWLAPPDFRIPSSSFELPASISQFIEPLARSFQRRWFPKGIKEMMNRDTRVIVDDRTLKFHVDDRRAEFRERYQNLCEKYGISS